MTNELEDWQLALLVEARSYNNPALVEANAAEALQRYRSLIDDAKEIDSPVAVDRSVKEQHEEAEALLDARSDIDGDWELVSKRQREQEQEALADVTEVLADALKDQYGLKDSFVESMSASAMVGQFRDDDSGEIKLDSLSQQPETGGQDSVEANAENKGDNPDDPEADADEPESPDEAFEQTGRSEQRDIAALSQKYNAMKDRTPKRAEALMAQIADLLDVETDALEGSEIDFHKKIEVV